MSAHKAWRGVASRGIAPLGVSNFRPAREHPHQPGDQPGDEALQQCAQLVVVGRIDLDEARCAIGVAAAHAVQDPAVQTADEAVGRYGSPALQA